MGFLTTAVRAWLLRSFRPFHFSGEYDNALDYKDIEALGLYVHIPFCADICSFCPYCKQLYDKSAALAYVDSLLKEIQLVCKAQEGKKDVTSLYFGGGSPALLIDELGIIIEKLGEYFNITDGIGVELHPSDVTTKNLLKLKSIGVTRISIGVQSFDKATLDKLGRTPSDYGELFECLKATPFDTVAMDFIFALKGQEYDCVKADIDKAFGNGANHIALYPFIDFAFSNSGIKKMSKRELKPLLYKISEYCEAKGYIRDSIWTFGKPGADKYSSMTRDNFLGFGCSATTLLKDQFKINTFCANAYKKRVSTNELPTALTIRFSIRERMIYWLFWRFYTTRLDPEGFERAFHTPLSKMYGLEIKLGLLLGLIKKEKGEYVLTPRGVFYYHHFEGYYTLAYIDRMWNIMRKEPFPKELTL